METSPRLARVVIVAAALVITLAGIRTAGGIIGPSFLALVLIITVYPLRVRLSRLGVPEWAASVITVITVYAILVAVVVMLVVSIGRLGALLPQYSDEVNDNLDGLRTWLSDLGVGDEQIRAVVNQFDVGSLVGVATDVLGQVLSLLSNLFLIATLLLFIAFDTTRTTAVLAGLPAAKADLVAAVLNFCRATRSYMGVSATFGLIVAVIDTAALYALGVPGALVWGVLAFVTNFIPNIGFVIGVVPPAAIALLEGGPGLMIAVVVIYSVINFVIQSVIQPRVIGDAVGLSTTLTFLSLVFWAWAIGPLGALLAVPLSLLMRALLVEADPDARWALPLISGRPDDVPVAAPAPAPVGPPDPDDPTEPTETTERAEPR